MEGETFWGAFRLSFLVTDAATDAPIRVIPPIGKRRQEHQVLLLEVKWSASVGSNGSWDRVP